MILKLLLNPFVFVAIGNIADGITTVYACLKYGVEKELISHTRAYMETFGVLKGIIVHSIYAMRNMLQLPIITKSMSHRKMVSPRLGG